jgi:threonine synthase
MVAKKDGLLLCPEGAATAAGYQIALEKKIINEDEKVVLFNCASGLKYPMPDSNQTIDKNSSIKYSQFT